MKYTTKDVINKPFPKNGILLNWEGLLYEIMQGFFLFWHYSIFNYLSDRLCSAP